MGFRGPIFCECCGKKLHEAKAVWLELDTRTDEYTSAEVPEQFSQGAFPFGSGCAKKVDAEKTVAAKLFGRYGPYEPRNPVEKAKAWQEQQERHERAHRWCVNGCGKEAAWYPDGKALLFDGACSAECLAAYEAKSNK